MAWEYKVVQGPMKGYFNRVINEEELNGFDEDGWELVTAFSTQGGFNGAEEYEKIFYIFRHAKNRKK